MALAIGLWVVLYLATHPAMDPLSEGMAITTAAVSCGFGGYVLIRRVTRGAQH